MVGLRCALILLTSGIAGAGISVRGPANFEFAKKELVNELAKLSDLNRKTWYCRCEIVGRAVLNCRTTMLQKSPDSLEWDHVVPAAVFPKPALCLKSQSSARKCARSRSRAFRFAEGDLVNLVPAEASVNQIKSSKLPNLSEYKFHFKCGFEVGPNSFIPPPDRRGDVARIWFHMNKKHFSGRLIGPSLGPILHHWNLQDPISKEEESWALQLAKLGNRHLFVPLKKQESR
jgi:endonuclease I